MCLFFKRCQIYSMEFYNSSAIWFPQVRKLRGRVFFPSTKGTSNQGRTIWEIIRIKVITSKRRPERHRSNHPDDAMVLRCFLLASPFECNPNDLALQEMWRTERKFRGKLPHVETSWRSFAGHNPRMASLDFARIKKHATSRGDRYLAWR
jgi:hypothetical protein